MQASSIELIATVIFALAVLHTFLCGPIRRLGNRFPEGSVAENLLHLLGEVEAVFGIWAAIMLLCMALLQGTGAVVAYTHKLNFTEPLFVLAIMAVSATRPVVAMTRQLILAFSRIMPLRGELAVYFSALAVGPLLGSFITEPAAMTVVALMLRQRYFENPALSERFKYITLGTLFVNISIGGVLTPYAAPPVLMVAGKWGWDLTFMLTQFGEKAALATFVNAAIATAWLAKELRQLPPAALPKHTATPVWVMVTHLFFLAMIVLNAHHPVLFLGFFLFFLGFATVSGEFQDDLKIRESLLVAYFLAGLVTIGTMQKWWLEIVLHKLDAFPLYLGASALTAITDNAALTYLGSQVENISDLFKYALVAGAVTGGRLTVIANAPNPAGFAILQDRFAGGGISPLKLFLAALLPTLVAMAAFWGLHP